MNEPHEAPIPPEPEAQSPEARPPTPPPEPKGERVTAASLRAGPVGGRRGDLSPGTSGYRQRRLQARRSGRRAFVVRWTARLVTLAVLLALIFVAARLVRGDGTESVSGGGGGDPVVLAVRDGGALKAIVLVDPARDRPLVVGMPASTLLEGPAGFARVETLLGGHDRTALLSAVSSLLGVRPVAVADLTWSDLRGALARAADTASRPPALGDGVEGAEAAAQAVAALAGDLGGDQGKEVTAVTLAEGDGGRVALDALRGLGDRGRPVRLPGMFVAGSDSTYYEPDVVGVRS